MPALIQTDDKRKCNARCYDARIVREQCSCACGGANHGVGLPQALRNTKALNGDWVVVVPKPAHVEADEQTELFALVLP